MIEIRRVRLFNGYGRRVPFSWCYSYRLPGEPWRNYGTHLASLRDWLKEKHPDLAVVEAWKVAT